MVNENNGWLHHGKSKQNMRRLGRQTSRPRPHGCPVDEQIGNKNCCSHKKPYEPDLRTLLTRNRSPQFLVPQDSATVHHIDTNDRPSVADSRVPSIPSHTSTTEKEANTRSTPSSVVRLHNLHRKHHVVRDNCLVPSVDDIRPARE